METLLMVAIIVTAIAIVTQAGVLIAMYLMSRKVAANVDGLVSESKRMMAPLEQVSNNVKSASDDLVVVGKVAREQMHEISCMVGDTRNAVTGLTNDVRFKVNDTVDNIREKVMQPARQWSAIMSGITVAIRTFFRRQDRDVSEPAA